MTEPDLHTFTGVHAMDALDSAERATFEAHLLGCAACRAEVAELTATASLLAAAAATPAPPGLRARVLAEVTQVRQQPPLTRASELDERRARRWVQPPVAVAAALVLVVSGGLGAVAVNEHQRAQRAEERATQVTAIATDPDRVEVDVPVTSGGHGTVIAADGTALLRTSDVATLPDDQVYQLWILRDGGAQSAGLLGRGGELEALVEGMRPTDALGVTIEPSDGSTRPTGDLVLHAEMA